jgi:hypothetical protein
LRKKNILIDGALPQAIRRNTANRFNGLLRPNVRADTELPRKKYA